MIFFFFTRRSDWYEETFELYRRGGEGIQYIAIWFNCLISKVVCI